MARPVEPAPLEGPVRFGPYTLARRIGAGGMGEVFLAREEAPRRACVVKKVLPQLMASPQFAGRFRDEARVVVRLHHPNIARVYAMGEVEGQLYLSMEYVQGKTLSRLTYRLRQLGRTLPLGIMLHLGQRLCEGLAYAHDATDEFGNPLHLVHRDLSPANVCISYAGEVKIIDFGAAQSTLKEQQTAPRVVIGNLTYMAPEQARKRFVDRRADVYAVGALLWELFAWKPLVQRGDPVERWRRAAYPQWEPAGSVRQGVPTSVDAFLMRALASEPDNRFPDAAAMGAELARMKAKLAPNVGDADVARLIAAAFPREKKAEELVLRELLREPRSRALTEPALATVLAPPTALAFEHEGIDAPEDYVPAERGDAETLKAPPDAAVRGTPAKAVPAAHGDADELEVTVRGIPGKTPEVPRAVNEPRVTALYGTEDEATVVEGEATVVQPARGPTAGAPRDADEETTVVQPERARMAADARTANPGASLGGDAAATEAVDAAKLMVALERAEATRSQDARAAVSEDVTVTEVNPARAPQSLPPQAAQSRRATRETQVGFGVDISQAVDAAAVEARRLELVRAITGDEALPAPAPEEDSGTWLRGGRPWLVAALCVGACALGLALAWALS
ncbi:serine/threonine protein kinase [Myxococcus sp. AM009]|uniref:serine/threonine protein kinase n=1 Tax=unclassified Myxococcus TaxID=2648731 RepID=UPI0015959796|nr:MULTISPECIES: serine/threonine-protein kinase [unclassified Myxococcus]NVJ02477.1 serine/threonine protein kinase [Myxococcus sp. AM009]NVJ19158.1 serine/threonine protein kinase [Myxococcus sp. AM010]